MIPGVTSASGSGRPVQVQRVGPGNVTFPAAFSATLPAAPLPGNLLLLFVRQQHTAETLDETNILNPGGTWVTLDGANNNPGSIGAMSWRLFAKDSDGSETTISPTFTSQPTSGAIEYQEWAGLAAAASAYDSGSSIKGAAAAANATWDPATVTPPQNKVAIAALIAPSGSSGTITSDWATATATYNGIIMRGHKIITDGSTWDTAITWTTTRTWAGVLAVLKGAT